MTRELSETARHKERAPLAAGPTPPTPSTARRFCCKRWRCREGCCRCWTSWSAREYLEETGFVWVKQKKKVEHCFDKVGRMVSYAAEITAYVEEFCIRRIQILVEKLHIFQRDAFSLAAARFGSRSRWRSHSAGVPWLRAVVHGRGSALQVGRQLVAGMAPAGGGIVLVGEVDFGLTAADQAGGVVIGAAGLLRGAESAKPNADALHRVPDLGHPLPPGAPPDAPIQVLALALVAAGVRRRGRRLEGEGGRRPEVRGGDDHGATGIARGYEIGNDGTTAYAAEITRFRSGGTLLRPSPKLIAPMVEGKKGDEIVRPREGVKGKWELGFLKLRKTAFGKF
ncbi:hypothetical protein Taro_015431 [Colocasia esculenta]|uniref:Uncharacterized protein n=1 Tax=Colocasia esculenta TaxID=4460 RepID=A0A843UHH9_COLES|nr:hypothetical protein [Colocasia esculenta]